MLFRDTRYLSALPRIRTGRYVYIPHGVYQVVIETTRFTAASALAGAASRLALPYLGPDRKREPVTSICPFADLAIYVPSTSKWRTHSSLLTRKFCKTSAYAHVRGNSLGMSPESFAETSTLASRTKEIIGVARPSSLHLVII